MLKENEINKAVLADLLREHPLPPVKVKKVRTGIKAGDIMWTVKFRNG